MYVGTSLQTIYDLLKLIRAEKYKYEELLGELNDLVDEMPVYVETDKGRVPAKFWFDIEDGEDALIIGE
jgi:hypothetical protein